HALLHRATRPRDAAGRIVATLMDYAVVRRLVEPLVSAGVGATVPATVRETVAAVTVLGGEDVTVRQGAAYPRLDKGAASLPAAGAARTRGGVPHQPRRPQRAAGPFDPRRAAARGRPRAPAGADPPGRLHGCRCRAGG